LFTDQGVDKESLYCLEDQEIVALIPFVGPRSKFKNRLKLLKVMSAFLHRYCIWSHLSKGMYDIDIQRSIIYLVDFTIILSKFVTIMDLRLFSFLTRRNKTQQIRKHLNLLLKLVECNLIHFLYCQCLFNILHGHQEYLFYSQCKWEEAVAQVMITLNWPCSLSLNLTQSFMHWYLKPLKTKSLFTEELWTV